MTIQITPEIEAAYGKYLDEQLDSSLSGIPILRRNTQPFSGNPSSGLVDFAAGFQAARASLLLTGVDAGRALARKLLADPAMRTIMTNLEDDGEKKE